MHAALNRLSLFVICFAGLAVLSACSGRNSRSAEIEALYDDVDLEIERRGEYMAGKQSVIDSLRKRLDLVQSPQEQLQLSNRLLDEYESYVSDSAFSYVNRSLRLAEQLGDAREQTRLHIREADIASHAGLFSEAHAMLAALNRAELDSTLLPDYYAAYCSLYQYQTEYLPEGKYSERTGELRDIYTDSLLSVAPRNSFDYLINWASHEINKGNREEARRELESNLALYQPGQRRYSIIASILAYLYKTEGNEEMAHRYLALTVISDIKGAVKENMAIRELATEVFDDGDIERANRYLKVSFDDANFYSARMRNAQSSRMLPVIDKAYDTRQHKLQRSLKNSLIAISALLVIVVLGVIMILKQMKRIREANVEIGKNNEDLSAMSERLKEINNELAETNKTLAHANGELKNSSRITEEYAGLFMEYCSLNINDLQRYHAALRKLAVQGNVQGILKKLDTNDVAADTLKTFYSKFDEAILNIYPQFVERVNDLLRDDAKLTLKSGEKLNTELRILALMRIGLNDSEKIAEFLRCSLATVYTYRSKMKKRAIDPERFESDIMIIGE